MFKKNFVLKTGFFIRNLQFPSYFSECLWFNVFATSQKMKKFLMENFIFSAVCVILTAQHIKVAAEN